LKIIEDLVLALYVLHEQIGSSKPDPSIGHVTTSYLGLLT